MRFFFDIGIFILNIIYFFHKISPVDNKVSIISRQSNTPSLDTRMISERLRKKYPEMKVCVIYKMIPSGILGKIKYLFHLIGPEMHALATSKVVILEGYLISASVLNHKKSLKIIQMWHALGICKKFGYLVAGDEEGYSSEVINGMRMHRNYDIILSSSNFCAPFFAKAFNYPLSKIKVLPLPRVDLLRSKEWPGKLNKDIISSIHGFDNTKKTILYAPTFRKGRDVSQKIIDFLNHIDKEKYNVILKLHPIEEKEIKVEGVLECEKYSSLELLGICDYVITDYSAFLFEATVKGVPVFLYTFDIEDYIRDRGFCIDFEKEAPGPCYKYGDSLLNDLYNGIFDMERQKAFADKFVEGGLDNTGELATLIYSLYNEGYE